MRFETTAPGGYFDDILIALALPKFEEGFDELLTNWQRAILAQSESNAAA